MNDLIKINNYVNIDILTKYYVPNHLLYALRYVDKNDQVNNSNFTWYSKHLIKNIGKYE